MQFSLQWFHLFQKISILDTKASIVNSIWEIRWLYIIHWIVRCLLSKWWWLIEALLGSNLILRLLQNILGLFFFNHGFLFLCLSLWDKCFWWCCLLNSWLGLILLSWLSKWRRVSKWALAHHRWRPTIFFIFLRFILLSSILLIHLIERWHYPLIFLIFLFCSFVIRLLTELWRDWFLIISSSIIITKWSISFLLILGIIMILFFRILILLLAFLFLSISISFRIIIGINSYSFIIIAASYDQATTALIIVILDFLACSNIFMTIHSYIIIFIMNILRIWLLPSLFRISLLSWLSIYT